MREVTLLTQGDTDARGGARRYIAYRHAVVVIRSGSNSTQNILNYIDDDTPRIALAAFPAMKDGLEWVGYCYLLHPERVAE